MTHSNISESSNKDIIMKEILIEKSKQLNSQINTILIELREETELSDEQYNQVEKLVNTAIMYGGIYNSINQIEQIEKMELTTSTGTWSL